MDRQQLFLDSLFQKHHVGAVEIMDEIPRMIRIGGGPREAGRELTSQAPPLKRSEMNIAGSEIHKVAEAARLAEWENAPPERRAAAAVARATAKTAGKSPGKMSPGGTIRSPTLGNLEQRCWKFQGMAMPIQEWHEKRTPHGEEKGQRTTRLKLNSRRRMTATMSTEAVINQREHKKMKKREQRGSNKTGKEAAAALEEGAVAAQRVKEDTLKSDYYTLESDYEALQSECATLESERNALRVENERLQQQSDIAAAVPRAEQLQAAAGNEEQAALNASRCLLDTWMEAEHMCWSPKETR
jgi:hypothetical protein